MAPDRARREADFEQLQSIDADANSLFVSRVTGVQQDFCVINIGLLDRRQCVVEERVKKAVRVGEVAGLILALEAFPMQVEGEVMILDPGRWIEKLDAE